ncbi:sigma-54 dependent transcriptional regulator [Neorhizobium sp. JUb45]|uniref:sigma-54-dependent transcriptional regulator n=1 Tax=unclassified Neorhizobium TaxID=2629175 RepID=UPI0010436B70|nr:sigma-54 dependent transcriptional regulator [Neorhizobium sp. JUb45]TCR06942.1 two-component system C4-dicarboxylate transport response regulator DctD [Neorhizobium sp. JUb45]
MSRTEKVFLIDDDADLLRATAQTLELAGFEAALFTSAADALSRLDAGFEGVIVSDIRMPGLDGLELFERVRDMDAELPVILMTGHGDIPMAVKAIQDGVYDFIAKPFATDRLIQCIRRAAEKRRLTMENRHLRQVAAEGGAGPQLLGQTPVMVRLRQTLKQIADTDVDVLVTGETGSGKEVVASLLHQWGRRAQGHFVALNCGALPEQIIESELFGHEPGAFTGAQKKRVGRIEHADGGTLFLDEIESMPMSTQVRMLRVLEMREVAPLGTNDIRPVDLRVVAAAKVDLGDPGQRASFREDLYYRLNVVSLSIPPLRERREDIVLLFHYFAEKAARRFSRDVPAMSDAVTRYLADHHWPGNVRELSHFAERITLGLEPVPLSGGASSERGGGTIMSLPERVDAHEAEIIRDTLTSFGGNVQQTIAALKIPRKTFYDKLQRYGIVRSDYAER